MRFRGAKVAKIFEICNEKVFFNNNYAIFAKKDCIIQNKSLTLSAEYVQPINLCNDEKACTTFLIRYF